MIWLLWRVMVPDLWNTSNRNIEIIWNNIEIFKTGPNVLAVVTCFSILNGMLMGFIGILQGFYRDFIGSNHWILESKTGPPWKPCFPITRPHDGATAPPPLWKKKFFQFSKSSFQPLQVNLGGATNILKAPLKLQTIKLIKTDKSSNQHR